MSDRDRASAESLVGLPGGTSFCALRPASVKTRVDLLLVERGLAPSRARAQSLLLAGRVYSGDARVEKAGHLLPTDAPLRVKEGERFVSRGGYKLEGALETLAIDVTGVVAVDVGASTGGFTDCLLQRRARRVYAVDVGHGQLAQQLREDARVVSMEGVNARHLEATSFDEPVQLVVVDASFIGLDKLLPAIERVLGHGGSMLAMVKPQFEVGREQARRFRGVIRDPEIREAAIARVREAVIASGFELVGECASSLPGPKGNLEHFLYARKPQS